MNRRCPPNQSRERIDGATSPVAAVRHDLLREHVEGVAQVARFLDLSLPHPIHDDGRLEQITPVLREDLAAARLADLMPRAPDALHAPRHRPRRFDLDDEIHGAHVDAELEAARRDDRPQRART